MRTLTLQVDETIQVEVTRLIRELLTLIGGGKVEIPVGYVLSVLVASRNDMQPWVRHDPEGTRHEITTRWLWASSLEESVDGMTLEGLIPNLLATFVAMISKGGGLDA